MKIDNSQLRFSMSGDFSNKEKKEIHRNDNFSKEKKHNIYFQF